MLVVYLFQKFRIPNRGLSNPSLSSSPSGERAAGHEPPRPPPWTAAAPLSHGRAAPAAPAAHGSRQPPPPAPPPPPRRPRTLRRQVGTAPGWEVTADESGRIENRDGILFYDS